MNIPVSESGAPSPSSPVTAKPPNTVINVAHRWPISPIAMASTIYGASGLTRPMRRSIMLKPERFFMP